MAPPIAVLLLLLLPSLLATAAATTLPFVPSAGNALRVNGDQAHRQYLTITPKCTADGNPFASANLTMALWFKFRVRPTMPLGVTMLAFARNQGPALGIGTALTKTVVGVANVHKGPGSTCRSPMDPTPNLYDGGWHHAALTVGAGFFAVYTDGAVQEYCTGVQAQQPTPSDSFVLGLRTSEFRSTSASPFDGDLDDVRIYNRVFTDADEFFRDVMSRPPTGAELARDLPVALSFDRDRVADDAAAGGFPVVVENEGFVPVAIELGGGQRIRTPTLVASTAPIRSRRPYGPMVVELVQDSTAASAPSAVRPLLITTPRYGTGPTTPPSSSPLINVTVVDVRRSDPDAGAVVRLNGTVLAANLTLTGVVAADARLVFEQRLGRTGRAVIVVRANVTVDGAAAAQSVRIVVHVRGNIRPVAGSGGQAAQFDGVDDFYMADRLAWPKVVSNATGRPVLGLAPITVEFWALVDGTKLGDSAVFSLGGNNEYAADWIDYFNRLRRSERWNVFLPEPDGSAALFAQNAAFAAGSGQELLGGWAHFAFVHEHHTGPMVRVFVNGELIVERDQGHQGMQNGFLDFNHATLGTWTFWSEVFFKGGLDDFRLWNRTRTGDEIRDAMYRQLTGSEPGLFAYWTFDDDADGVVVDRTGRGNDLRAGGCVPCEPRFYCQPFSVSRYEFSPDDCVPSAKSTESPRFRTHTCFGGTVCFQGEERDEMRPVLVPSGAPIGGHTFDMIGYGGQPIEIRLNGTDPDATDFAIRFEIVALPGHGQLQYRAADGTWAAIAAAPFQLPLGLDTVRLLSAPGDGGHPFAQVVYAVRDPYTASLPVAVDVDLLCPRGQYLDAGAHRCAPCPPGSYSNADGVRTACDLCAVNEFQPNAGQTSCLRCAPGKTFSSAPGATACAACNATSAGTNPAGLAATASFCALSFQTDNKVSAHGGLRTQLDLSGLVPAGVAADTVRVTLLNVPQFGSVFQVGDDGAATDDDFRDYFSSAVDIVGQYAARVVGVAGGPPVPDRSANATLGEPDAGRGGSSARAWAPDAMDSSVANLTLQFPEPLFVTGVVVYENVGGGAVTQVEARRPDGTFDVLWRGDPLPNGLGAGRQFRPDLCPTPFATDTLRLTVNSLLCHGRNEVDAVRMLGARDRRQSGRLLVRSAALRVAYAPPTLAGVGAGAPLGYRYTDTISYAVQSCRGGGVLASGVQTLQGTLGRLDLADVRPGRAGTTAALTLAAVGLAVCAASAGLVVRLRAEPILRASSIFFLNAMLLGLGLGFLVLLLTAVHGLRPLGAGFCMARAVLFSVGFNLLMGSIIVKTARIVVIFELTRGARVVRVTNARLFAVVVAMVVIDLGFLLTALALDPLRDTVVLTASSRYVTCDSALGGLLLHFSTAYKAVLALAGLALALKGRNVPSTFNEARSLSFMTYTIATNSLIYLIVSGLVSDDPNAALIILTFTLSVALFSTWAILVAAKLFIVWFRPDQNAIDTGTGTGAVASKVRTVNAAKYSATGARPSLPSRTVSRIGTTMQPQPQQQQPAPEGSAGEKPPTPHT